MVVVHTPVLQCLVGCDLVGIQDFVADVNGIFPVVYFSTYCHCSVEYYEMGFIVVKFLLWSVGSSCVIVVFVQNVKCSWFACISSVVR